LRTRTGLLMLALLCVLVGTAGAGILRRAGARAAAKTPAVVSSVRTDQKVVALTFDDGPDPRYTPGVLELARTEGIKVTFFAIGRKAERYPDLVKQELADGHAVGNHTWDHHTMSGLSQRQDQSEILDCEQVLDRLLGQRPHLLRPPKGLWSPRTYRAATSLGFPIVLWSIELEHHPGHTPEQLARRAIGLTRPGTIVLAHDGTTDHPDDRTKTLETLPILVQGLRQKGYRFVTIPELLALSGASRQEAVVPHPPVE
jgi:peptidoglycan-N-acetylglucosamine deacetylase